MKFKNIVTVIVTTGLIYANALPLDNASPKVQELIKKNDLQLVDTKYVSSVMGKGTRVSAKSVIIDARPSKKYVTGHVPASINIPDTKFDEFYGQIQDLNKSKELITYCGGWKCVKSAKLANMLKSKGFENVKVYQAGFPAWEKSGNYIEVGTAVVKSATTKTDIVIIDARPLKKYKLSHIPGAIGIPDTKVDNMLSQLPKNKDEKIIVYCGGYKCAKSHNLAKKLLELGYQNVAVYAAGLPVWIEVGLPVDGKKVQKKIAQESDKDYISKGDILLVKNQVENKNMVYGPWYLEIIRNLPKGYVLVDVRDADSFASGHLPKAINIPFDDKKRKEFISKITKLQDTVILSCASGAMSTEAITAVIDEGVGIEKIFFVDANIDCNKNNECTVKINDPL